MEECSTTGLHLVADVWGCTLSIALASPRASHEPVDTAAACVASSQHTEQLLSRQSSMTLAAASPEVRALRQRLRQDPGAAAMLHSVPGQLERLDTQALGRWLSARGGSVEAAAEALAAHAAWRAQFMPNGHVHEAEVAVELAARKAFLQGCDSRGRPVLVIQAARHDMRVSRSEETKRFICYVLDNTAAAARNEYGQFLCLFDLAGLRMRNLDVAALTAVFELLQQHYPERLGELWFLNAPLIFWGLWRVVGPFIQPATRDKIRFLAAGERDAVLQASIPPQVLPEQYGGAAPLLPVEEAVQRRQQAAATTPQQAPAPPAAGHAAAAGPAGEGRLRRAGRAISGWAAAGAGFLRNHNPVHGVAESRAWTAARSWRPFGLGRPLQQLQRQASIRVGKQPGAGGSAEGSKLAPLLQVLLPQSLLAVILRTAQQAIRWAISRARRSVPQVEALPQDAVCAVAAPSSSSSSAVCGMENARRVRFADHVAVRGPEPGHSSAAAARLGRSQQLLQASSRQINRGPLRPPASSSLRWRDGAAPL